MKEKEEAEENKSIPNGGEKKWGNEWGWGTEEERNLIHIEKDEFYSNFLEPITVCGFEQHICGNFEIVLPVSLILNLQRKQLDHEIEHFEEILGILN